MINHVKGKVGWLVMNIPRASSACDFVKTELSPPGTPSYAAAAFLSRVPID